jgi:hypothetical protein
VRDGRHLEDGKRLHRVVIAGVVAIRPLVPVFVETDLALDDDLGRGRNAQRLADALDELDPPVP